MSRKSPAVETMPRDVESPAVEMPPLNEEVAVLVDLIMPAVLMAPVMLASPATLNRAPGVLVAMPTKPFWLRTINDGVVVPMSETMKAPYAGLLDTGCSTARAPHGEEVPMPIRRLVASQNRLALS